MEHTVAQRNSKNRLDRTVELKPVAAVTRADYVDMLLDNVIPAVAANVLVAANTELFTYNRSTCK